MPFSKNCLNISLLFIIAIALAAPFVLKPFHIDDDIYIKNAEQIRTDPLHPLGGHQDLFGQKMSTYHFTQHPPLVPYYIALIRTVSGNFNELKLHLFFIFFSILASLAVYLFAQRFSRHPLGIALLTIFTPAFMVMSQDVMTDMAFLAFYFISIVTFIHGIDKNKPLVSLISSFFLTITCFIQYRGLILLPILFFYSLWFQENPWKSVFLLVPPLLSFALWSLYNLYDFGSVHFLDAWGWIEFKPGRLLQNLISYLSFMGGATIFPIYSLFMVRNTIKHKLPLLFIALITLPVTFFYVKDYPPLEQLLFVLFFITGFLLFVHATPSLSNYQYLFRRDGNLGPSVLRVKENAFLLVLLAVPLLSQIILNLFASVRSLLIVLPTLMVMAFRKTESAHPGASKARIFLGIGITVTLFWGIAFSIADWQYADSYKQGAGLLAKYRQDGNRIFFTGEWGFRHYLEKNGFIYLLTKENPARPGDIVIVPGIPCPSPLNPDLQRRLVQIDQVVLKSECPIRLMNPESHAGFYSDGFGMLPVSFSNSPLDSINIYRVKSTE